METARTALENLVEQAFQAGLERHGDLGFHVDHFSSHLLSIVARNQSKADEALDLLSRLHTADLYLSGACAAGVEAAWTCLYETYTGDLRESARRHGASHAFADEISHGVIGELSLPDCSGRRRIAGYEGRCPLHVWLKIIVKRRVLKETSRVGLMESLEFVIDMPGPPETENADVLIFEARYRHMLQDSLKAACRQLTSEERDVLLSRYERRLAVSKIAERLGVSAPTATRYIRSATAKIRREFISTLREKWRLSDRSISECLAAMSNLVAPSLFAAIRKHKRRLRAGELKIEN